MANTANDTLAGVLGAIAFPEAPDLNATETGATPAPTTTVKPKPTSPATFDEFLADWQSRQLKASQSFDSYFESEEGAAKYSQLQDTIMPEEMPEPPKLVEEFEKKRDEYNLDELEASLNDIKRQEREQQAIRRERIGNTYEQRSRLSAIQGQVSEIERQEMERIDFLQREGQYYTDVINSAYNVINLYTNLLNTDWQNAKEWWSTKFNANMKMYQQLRTEFVEDRSYEQQRLEYEQTVAKSNLQIYVDLITNGELFLDNIDSATETEIKKLEIQSGLGVGFLSKIAMSPDKQVKSITTRVAGTTKYADIVRIDPRTGKVSVESVKLGKSYTYSGGGGGSSSSTSEADKELQSARQGAAADLAAKAGADGHVSPTTWNIVRSQWLGMGYSSDLFNQYFGNFVNQSHWQDYSGYKAAATEGDKMGGQTGGYPQVPSSVNTMA
jgi:hypothetical protein